MQVELRVRYRAGPTGARITFGDGSVVQLEPFASYRFEKRPVRIEGMLTMGRRRHDRQQYETKAG